MRVEISKLHKKLKTNIIYVTHDQIEAMTLADWSSAICCRRCAASWTGAASRGRVRDPAVPLPPCPPRPPAGLAGVGLATVPVGGLAPRAPG